MSDVPSWLTEENISTAATVTSNPAAQKAAKKLANPPPPPPPPKPVHHDVEAAQPATPTSSSSPASEMAIDPGTLKEMQSYHLILRVAYMGAAAFMGLAAGLALQGQSDLGKIFFALYVLFFGTLICCFEVGLTSVAKLIAINFGFMYSLLGRAIFLLFVGFMVFSLSFLGKISMAVLYVVGCFHAYILWKYPRFEEYMRKKHFFEGQKAEAL